METESLLKQWLLTSGLFFLTKMSNLDWAESRLAEIELLTSMFPTQEELDMTDQLALAELREYVEGTASTDTPPQSRLQFLIKQKMDTADMERVTNCNYRTFSMCHKTRKIITPLFFAPTDGCHSVVCLSTRISQCVARNYCSVSICPPWTEKDCQNTHPHAFGWSLRCTALSHITWGTQEFISKTSQRPSSGPNIWIM